MKKIIILTITIFFCTQSNIFSQTLDELYAKLSKTQQENIYLKDFEFNLEPGELQRYSVVLSKRTLYAWYAYVSEKNQFQLTLFDDQENVIFHNKSSDEGVVSFTIKCNKTKVYHLFIKNTSSKPLNSTVLLTFAGKFKPKDIDEITPIQQSENQTKPQLEYTINEEAYYFAVDKMPKFKGQNNNADDFRKFLQNEIKYPQEAIDKKIKGRVSVQFIVDKNGYIKNAKVVRGVHSSIDQEALRIVYSSPKWKPGIKDGQTVDVILTYPIEFKLP